MSDKNDFDLGERALQVSLGLKKWQTWKRDDSLEEVATKEKGIDRDVVKASKCLDKGMMDDIKKMDNKIRQYHYDHTLPWERKGWNIIKAEIFLDYSKQMREFKAERESLVKRMIQKVYPIVLRESMTYLGQCHNPDDFPSPDDLEQLYTMEVDSDTLTTSKDWRVDVGAKALQEFKKKADANARKITASAMQSAYEKVYKAVNHMAAKLGDSDAVFHDTLVENIVSICDILPNLNITNDSELEKMRQEILAKLTLTPTKKLRKDPKVRNEIAEEAKGILDKMGGLMPMGPPEKEVTK